jgi:hypothetical protein
VKNSPKAFLSNKATSDMLAVLLLLIKRSYRVRLNSREAFGKQLLSFMLWLCWFRAALGFVARLALNLTAALGFVTALASRCAY